MAHDGLSFVPARFGTRHGITQQLAVEGAAANLRHMSDGQVIALAASLIRNELPNNRRSRRAVASTAARKANRRSAIISEQQPATWAGESAHQKYIRNMLAPNGNAEVVGEAAVFWIPGDLHKHAADLERLRVAAPNVYEALLQGSFATAAKLGLQIWDETALRRVLDCQARLLIIAKAHALIKVIRQIATAPYDQRFSGFKLWKTAGHVLLATVAAPASVVQRLCLLASASPLIADPDRLHAYLASQGLLPKDAGGERIVKLACSVERKLEKAASTEQIASTACWIFNLVKPVAALDSAALAKEGLSRTSFVEWRTGFSGSEAATLVAIDLVRSLNAVPNMVEAVLQGATPVVDDMPFSARRITYTAVLLRADGNPDKESFSLARDLGCDGGLSPANRSSRKPLASLQRKRTERPELVTQFETNFGIDAADFFKH